MNQEEPRYISFLIRMWQVKGRRGWQWQASLESPGRGERRGFPSVDGLIAFLRAQIGYQEPDKPNDELDE